MQKDWYQPFTLERKTQVGEKYATTVEQVVSYTHTRDFRVIEPRNLHSTPRLFNFASPFFFSPAYILSSRVPSNL